MSTPESRPSASDPATDPTTGGGASMLVDGRPVPVDPGQSVGSALMRAGIRSWRTTRKGGRPRGLFCGIGVCYDCLVTIDGRPGQRACVSAAAPGLRITTGDVRLEETP